MSGPIRSALMTAKSIKLNHAPSEAQKAAGNYKKHHVRMHGLDIALENVKGGKRSGVDRDGRRWAVTMPAHYGYIKRTEGADGDHVDVYIGPDHASKNVYVIDQKDAETGKFDEHKVMLGFGSEAQARATYLKGFSDGKGAQRIQSIKPMTIDQFKEWLKGDTTKRIGRSTGGRLELDRAKEAKKRAPGQVSPSKHMPGVPRQVRAEGGEVDDGGFDVYHSSPHDFDQFDMSRMGTGEGNQMYGHGLYFAEAPEVSGQGGKYWQQFWNKMKVGPEESAASALFYSKFDRDKAIENLKKQANYHLSESSKNYGNGPEEAEGHKALHKDYLAAADLINSGKIVGPKTYEVRIKAPEERFLDWDAPISEQHEGVLKAIAPFFPAGVPDKNQYGAPLKGGDIYHQVLQRAGGVMHGPVLDKAGIPGQLPGGTKERLSKYLLNMGVPGIKYLDAGSRMRGAGTKNYVVFDDKLTHVKRKYAEGGEVDDQDPTPDIQNPMSIFPKPQRMFPEDARPPGGQYLAMPDRRDVTGHKAEAATIGVQPGGKPFFNVSQNAVEQTGSTGRGTAMARANLFKQKAGWKWLNAPEEHGSTDTIVSVEHRGKHHYALNAHFPRGVDLARYENSPTEPRLRPTTTGNVQLGPQAGSILVRGKEHPVYRHVIVKETGGLVAPQYENPVKLAKKALMAAKKTGSRS